METPSRKNFPRKRYSRLTWLNKKKCNPLQPSNPSTAVLLNTQFPSIFKILRNVTQRRLLPEVLYSFGRKKICRHRALKTCVAPKNEVMFGEDIFSYNIMTNVGYQMLFSCSDCSTEDETISTSKIDQGNRELERM